MPPIYIILIIYVSISIPLFLLVFNASKLVVDEEFHLKQGQHYCMGNFHVVSFLLYSINCISDANQVLLCLYSVGSKNNHVSWVIHCVNGIFITSEYLLNFCTPVDIIMCISYQRFIDIWNSEELSTKSNAWWNTFNHISELVRYLFRYFKSRWTRSKLQLNPSYWLSYLQCTYSFIYTIQTSSP